MDRSVRQSVDPFRRGVHGPGVSVFGSPRDLGNTMHESLKRTSQWSAYYFTYRRSYYPVPENSISLRDIPKMSPMPPMEVSQADQTLMREWAQEHGKAVRQRTVRQCTTKHTAGTLPLNIYEKESPIGERVTFENASHDQDSEYDSGSDDEERESAEDQGEDSLDLNAINFLSRSVRTRSGRVISLSHRALASAGLIRRSQVAGCRSLFHQYIKYPKHS